MTDNTCKNCIFWKRYGIPGRGFCRNENFGEIEIGKQSMNDASIKGLAYWGYGKPARGGFDTGEDFGCIHFEEKS